MFVLMYDGFTTDDFTKVALFIINSLLLTLHFRIYKKDKKYIVVKFLWDTCFCFAYRGKGNWPKR